ncbi:LuxR C-terminal-related transcriptional regulator [Arthrobacter sp. StoSoilB5]|uniref:helix-turn-helix transcriptional regulator n=1 Tax=Arthrobacter sp. StoSoilB5 TaxID=2830992 RepID=UPI001CC56EFF|nr:LuxR C-terminal-related transcriptional regulator [Arthrobacter sp. StoSoilB5]BCW44364.1 hypothetical protein StoSoilB5_15480 [Arthrobacter sp. StoSoilB5]
MASSWATYRTRERIEDLFLAAGDDHALREAALAEIRHVVGFSAFVWPLTDPESATGVAPMAAVPCPNEVPLVIKARYASRINRWTVLSEAARPAASLFAATAGDPARHPLWDTILRGYGVGDIASLAFADQHGIWSWLDLWREATDPAFSVEELEFLVSLAPAMTLGLRRSRAQQFAAAPVGPKGAMPAQAVLVMDEDMRVLGQTSSASDWLSLLQRAPRPHAGIPAEVYNVVAQLLAKEAQIDNRASAARIHVGGGQWASLRAARMDSPTESPNTPAIAVTIQECLPAARLGVFVRAYGLTARERQALALLAAGLENESLANRMGISPLTAQDHFKGIFAKTGMHSRAGVLALAFGSAAAGESGFVDSAV